MTMTETATNRLCKNRVTIPATRRGGRAPAREADAGHARLGGHLSHSCARP